MYQDIADKSSYRNVILLTYVDSNRRIIDTWLGHLAANWDRNYPRMLTIPFDSSVTYKQGYGRQLIWYRCVSPCSLDCLPYVGNYLAGGYGSTTRH